MGWYDAFSRWYDASLEPLYAEQRVIAARALDLAPGQLVLDLPTGTGQSLPHLLAGVGETGRVLGVDLSTGMLDRARERLGKLGTDRATLLHRDVATLDSSIISDTCGRPTVDRLHVFLGLSAFPDWDRNFARLWDLLAPGGRCVVVDVHADPLGFQGRMVNLVARADIRRRTWEPLEGLGEGFTRVPLPQRKEHGGAIFCATATKPRTP